MIYNASTRFGEVKAPWSEKILGISQVRETLYITLKPWIFSFVSKISSLIRRSASSDSPFAIT